jgi:hypothetical protein
MRGEERRGEITSADAQSASYLTELRGAWPCAPALRVPRTSQSVWRVCDRTAGARGASLCAAPGAPARRDVRSQVAALPRLVRHHPRRLLLQSRCPRVARRAAGVARTPTLTLTLTPTLTLTLSPDALQVRIATHLMHRTAP